MSSAVDPNDASEWKYCVGIMMHAEEGELPAANGSGWLSENFHHLWK
jgi:hypothetical protein